MERRLGVSTRVWTRRLTDASLAELAAHAARLGFNAIELPLENLGDWDPAAAREILAGHGLAPVLLAVMSPGRNLVAAPAAEIDATRRYLGACIDAAAELGATTLAGPLYAAAGRTWSMTESEREAAYAQLRTGLAPLVDRAVHRGVTLAVEPLNRYETSFINTVDAAFDALEPLLGPGLGMALDSFHLNIEERDIAAAIARAVGHIAHVRVSGNDRGTVGADHFDWHGFIHALDVAGYTGPLCVESLVPGHAPIWRSLASSQDALAADSLGYLKNLQAGGLRWAQATSPPATGHFSGFVPAWQHRIDQAVAGGCGPTDRPGRIEPAGIVCTAAVPNPRGLIQRERRRGQDLLHGGHPRGPEHLGALAAHHQRGGGNDPRRLGLGQVREHVDLLDCGPGQ